MSGASTLSPYLVELIKDRSCNRVEFRSSTLGGLGCFALESLKPDDVLFKVPRRLILASNSPVVRGHPVITLLRVDKQITAESLLFVYMALEAKSGRNQYLNTLTPLVGLIAAELSGTNVGAQVVADDQELQSQLVLINAVLPEMTIEELVIAKRQYNSRRYPARFALSVDTTVSSNDSLKRNREDVDNGGDVDGGPRRCYDRTHGCLCPLLDILNHSTERGEEPLSYGVESDDLVVRTTVAYQAGDEVFSNYGCLNNDSLLLQFGFCDMDSGMDVVCVKVAGGSGSGYHLRSGHIPEVLLGDGGEGLYHLLRRKKKALPAKPTRSSDDSAVRHYMRRQRVLLKALLTELDNMSG